MRYVRLALLAAVAATLLSGSALAQGDRPSRTPRRPQAVPPPGQRAPAHDFSRTPSFSWSPVRGACRYEFQLAKNVTFNESSIFWVTGKVRGPATAIPLSLPWMTGKPYAAYARVRAVNAEQGLAVERARTASTSAGRTSRSSCPSTPGLSRWTPVEGATGYEVWFTNIGGCEKHVTMRTNAVDHREAYAFHDGAGLDVDGQWRVRAVRNGDGDRPPERPPRRLLRPVEPEYTSNNAAAVRRRSRRSPPSRTAPTSKAGDAHDHELTPAFAFSGREALNTFGGSDFGLYRVYVATDSDCVNVIYKGAVVGSPGLCAPDERAAAAPDRPDEGARRRRWRSCSTTAPRRTRSWPASCPSRRPSRRRPTPRTTTATERSAGSSDVGARRAPSARRRRGRLATTPKAVDLPESGWPNGRFYWTVVPVEARARRRQASR